METNPTERTSAIIAGEIVAIKVQTRKILLVCAVEVGRCLAEAREIIPYGASRVKSQSCSGSLQRFKMTALPDGALKKLYLGFRKMGYSFSQRLL